MRRKTISVASLVDEVNRSNRETKAGPIGKHWRDGWNSVLEKILFDTDNYNGFGYLTESQVPQGELPGMRSIGDNAWENTDSSRIQFFTKASIDTR